MTRVCAIGLTLLVLACSPAPEQGPQTGGQTNWLVRCNASEQCGELECICGACSASCEGGSGCGNLPGATCVAATDEGANALCAGQVAPVDVCLPSCEVSCDDGLTCIAGVCVPVAEAAVSVTIDTATTGGTLVGFGASLAYAEDVIVANPHKAALYDLVFSESGLDVLRMGNRYAGAADPDLAAATEIVSEAASRLGRMPTLFMTSASPPAALKANASVTCAGEVEACTLVTLAQGGFDYAGFGAYWRSTIQGYAAAGIAPDYVGIQNDPDWIPDADAPHEGCRMLPQEGSTDVEVDGVTTAVTYPGYREALLAVRSAVANLPDVPAFIGPEAGDLAKFAEYGAAMDASSVEALAIHLYDVDANAVDSSAFRTVRDAAGRLGMPVFQTEMQADGLHTAILVHHAFSAASATAYLQNDLVSWTPEMASIALVLLGDTGPVAQGPYWALLHYAKHTDPGWLGIAATSESADVLATAWVAPGRDALTVVLVNPRDVARDVQLLLPGDTRAVLTRTSTTRTVFEGSERAAELGALAPNGVVTLPGGSIVTVAFVAE